MIIKKSISSNLFKDFLENILNGKINDNKIENYIREINDIEKNDIEKDLNKSRKSKKINKLKNYIKKIKKSVYKKDKCRVRNDEAKPFEDQKGKGYIDLPILLSYLNINSSKELISNIEQLINDLYDNEKITKQVYNNLIKEITYKN